MLLKDIIEVGSEKSIRAHFIGSIVYIHDDVYTTSKLKELTIIDGQQRITTLTLLYLVLYNFAKILNDNNLESEIFETYIINKHSPEDEKLKLRPADNNDKALKYLIRGDRNEEFLEYSKIIENYNYFKSQIKEDNYRIILDGLSKLLIVEISLEYGKDDPQKIFESLNSTGLALSQADLIRNYILMGLKRRDQNRIYINYWEIIENLAKDEIRNVSCVSDFIRDYLTLVNKKIPNKSKVYEEFKEKYPTDTLDALEDVLEQLKSFAKHYNKLINPDKEPDRDIQRELNYISRLEINVAYPFLIMVYDDYQNLIIEKEEFLDILVLVQSYVFRRFICNLQTNALNKIFMNLYDKVDKSNYLTSIQKTLLQKTGVQRFPKNLEIADALKVRDVYNIQTKNRAYLLERLENFENREIVSIDGNTDITVEHIFPQNPDPKWKILLGNDEYIYIKENYIHTIANLTLSGNNGKLGNKTFLEKKEMDDSGYKDSRLWLNKYISSLEKWNKEEIEKRFSIILERFLKIWKMPDIFIENETGNEECNIFDAEDPKHKKLEYAIFFDQKLEINQVAQLYVAVIKQLFDLQPETFFNTDLGYKVGLTKNPELDNVRQPVQINETYFIEANIDNIGKFNRIKYALTLFECEDEVFIKYIDN